MDFVFDKDFKFYYFRESLIYILAIKKIDLTIIEKYKFSINGVLINKVIDNLQDDGSIIRNTGNKDIILKDNDIIMINQKIDFKAV